MKGLIHVYTGEGKGKTSAALGLALRFAGYGKNVLIVQFLKGGETGEILALQKLANVKVIRNSIGYGFYPFLDDKTKEKVKKENTENLTHAIELCQNGGYDLLVLDEALPAYNICAIDKGLLISFIQNKPIEMELALTGRDMPKEFEEFADYVSGIEKIKHPYDKGVPARLGAEY